MTLPGGIETLNPPQVLFSGDWQALTLVYEGLVGYKTNSVDTKPLLAESYQMMDNGRRCRFTLRAGVRFQDSPCFPNGAGREMTADDVLFTFENMARQWEQVPYYPLFGERIVGLDDFAKGHADSIFGIVVIDARRIDFYLTKSYSTFIKMMASPAAMIIPREAVSYYGNHFDTHPVGTGPFKLARWRPFTSLEFVRNDHYWQHERGDTLPYLDKISIDLTSTSASVFSEFTTENCDLFQAQERISRQLPGALLDSTQYKMTTAPAGLTTRMFVFSFKNSSEIAANKKMRQAIAAAFREEQEPPTDSPFANQPANTLVPPAFWMHHQPDTLVNSATQNTVPGNKIPIRIVSNIKSHDVHLLEKCLNNLGLSFKTDIIKTGYFRSLLTQGWDICRVAFVPGFIDFEDYYSLFYSKSNSDVNLGGFRDAAYDSLFERAAVEKDPAQREHLFISLENVIRDKCPVILISHSQPDIFFSSRRMHGLESVFIFPDLSRIWLDQSL